MARFLAVLAAVWRPATPADPPDDIVERQVCQRAGLRPGSPRGYLAAISVAHASAGQPNPTHTEVVRRTMAGIANRYGRRPRDSGLTRNSIRLIIIQRAAAAGLDPHEWGANSLRRIRHLRSGRRRQRTRRP